MDAAARVRAPPRGPVGSFPLPLEAGDRIRVGLCAADHTTRVPHGAGGDEGYVAAGSERTVASVISAQRFVQPALSVP
jgi:hypothetical protein